ncbi:AQG_2a_G0032790.mRNA.1.CDS.1 [Saccharomyces cerevisiae]|uniref:Splicing factor YJU2 n=5 Tax=Saccharomyces cerevisiae TaxID=4932 RepID=YJU2_YEAST|nr:mRNA splicing protein YJU2 [Saccharomyces cerevisiae S288C]P28320.1 RecName: Full=Splicing factor YJU2 [Saccharomyces cerevisiae S288C]5GMK_F Chain F, Protein CWC16 [Saccharomyces cerevisiae S288C]5LJ3_D Chain D, Protein CWC16 [Saccharomyces cerevisiae]5LJ5_D Chain D, Protein CWC16 [Saccharomyces cerevisiae]5Y88_R Chain R, Protein CWC16 [Saccharomyces cerevisiae S288C]6EXN_D Chain D, Pre-mRNA-splicing factor CWC16 [Saccharomyces cerevisiae S288C]6J6Q_F Chain F, Splicing factor YJU2 [Sacch|eukprot:NP_012828.1 mRNA splicing protein YJU2 [Saccharomyces cerevisiae S288C]
MSERKAINKYYPPDYNPLEAEKLSRKMAKKLKTMNKSHASIRLMTPFSMRCLECNEYIPKSRKFNGKKELLKEKYLDSIKIYRLTISCPRCANSIAFRTDPGNSDYVMEVGGVRNYVPQKPNDDLNAKTAVESIDETLQRLVREKEMEQNEKMGIKEQADDKMDLLEKRLAKIQQEQEDDEELENLRKKNLEMSQRAEMINRSKHAQQEKAVTTDDLDNLVDQVFDNHRQRTNKPGNNNDEKRTPLFNPTSTKGKIQKKSSVRTNPLGIVIKRGKSLK